MNVRFHDKCMREFTDGKHVKAFSGFSRHAEMNPDQIEAAAALKEQNMARTAIHPGEHLATQLKELGMSAAELGRQLKVPTNRITGILNGQRAITGDSALRLAHFFGNSPEF